MARTGKRFALLSVLALFSASAWVHPAAADDVKFTAEVDRNQISVDESVSLKMVIDASSGNVGDPQYSAPDFELLNQYNSVSSTSFYDESTGRIGMKTTYEINKVLKPTKTGTFRITGIQVSVGGQVYRAPDLEVEVASGGEGTPPPRGYGGSGVGLRGAGKRTGLPSVFARAEIDKGKAYKGEKVVVSYYIYERARAFNIEITKYPTLNGFLRQELEMPYLNRKLDMEQVVLDGVPYVRALLVRYAAFPLQEGKLEVDSMELKYNYYNQSSPFDSSDPFASMFRQALPGNSHSEPLRVDVVPLPDAGRPNSFSGGVGDFTISSAIDKTEVHANEPVTLTVNIEGNGNVDAVTEPKAKWPENVELYDTKGSTKPGKGAGQKVFEFLLIPRQPGPLELPSLEFSYFDPKKGAYLTKNTAPVKINVLPPVSGSAAYVPKSASGSVSGGENAADNSKTQLEPRGLKMPGEGPSSGVSGFPMWRWLYWISLAGFGIFALLVGRDLVMKASRTVSERAAFRARQEAKSWGRLKGLAQRMTQGTAWNEVVLLYDSIAGQIHDAIDRIYGVGSRSYSREELARMLVDERGMPDEVWRQAASVLEFAELVHYASTAGAVSENAARSEAVRWVSEAEQVSRMIERKFS